MGIDPAHGRGSVEQMAEGLVDDIGEHGSQSQEGQACPPDHPSCSQGEAQVGEEQHH